MKVLVADDDITNRLILKAMLETEGHEVCLAVDGQEAVELFVAEKPHMVLMDLMMPVMDGEEATRRIKSLGKDYFIPIIFVTAITDTETLSRCIEAGGDDFITKPFNRAILRAKILALRRIHDLYRTIIEQKDQLALHNERTMREHEFAEKIFDSIVYHDNTSLPCVHSMLRPAEMFSGDILLVSRMPSGGLCVLIGDVTGHGLSAAICSMPVAEIFYSMTAKGFHAQLIVNEINDRLSRLLPTGVFFAACLLQVDAECRAALVWNGGIPGVYLRKLDDGLVEIPSRYLPLGILDSGSFDSQCELIEIRPGDRLIAHTDGLVENATHAGKNIYDSDEVIRLLAESETGAEFLHKVQGRLQELGDQVHYADDITLVDIECDPDLFQDSDSEHRENQAMSSRAWKVEFELKADVIRSIDPLPHIIQLVTGMQELQAHRSQLFTILSELYNNSVDHGLLGLDSALKNNPEGFMQYYTEREKRMHGLEDGFVRIRIRNEPLENGAVLSILMEDSGPGFNQEVVMLDVHRNYTKGGRGIPLLRNLCEELTYNDAGNQVVARYRWC